MMLALWNGVGSVILRFKIADSTLTNNGGKTLLTFASSGLIISTIADNEATPTVYTAAGATIETVTTLGTFATPTATKCRFKEVDATNHPGLYEVQIANARWGVSGSRYVDVTISGVSGAAQVDGRVQIPTRNLSDATNSATPVIPGAAPGAANGLFIAGTNAATAITTALTANIVGNITGNLSGSAGSVTGNVGGIAGTTQTLDALQTALSSSHGAGSWATATGFSTLTAAQVWDLATSGHTTAGTFGEAVVAAASGGNPFTTTLTESYAADGAAATAAQLLYMIWSRLVDHVLPGTVASTTTGTMYKLDGTTAWGTLTLSLTSGGNPVRITRAT